MTALLQQPNLPGKVDGIIALDPPTLQCRDCGEVWTSRSERTQRPHGLATTVTLSHCHGWAFCRHCGPGGVRRCGACHKAHREALEVTP